MKINATELKNFTMSESKFKSQTKWCCTTALQKYAPKIKSLLGLYSKHFYSAEEKSLNRNILAVTFCLIFSDIISKYILASLKIQRIYPRLPCEKQELKAIAV